MKFDTQIPSGHTVPKAVNKEEEMGMRRQFVDKGVQGFFQHVE